MVALAKDLANDLEELIRQLRRLPGDAGALGFVSLVEEVFVLVRVRGQHVQVLLSDGTAADDWPIARDVADFLGEEIPDDDDDEDAEPMGDLGILADLGLSDFDLGNIVDDLDLDSDEMLIEIAEKIKINPQFRVAAEAAMASWRAGAVPSMWDGAMREALDEAVAAARHDDVPIGAVVLDPERAGRRTSRQRAGDSPVTRQRTPRCSRSAGPPERQGSWRLIDHTLVVTLEPCTMCAGALVLARVARLVFGAYDPKAGAVASLFDVVRDPRLNHRVDVRGGILEAECGDVLRSFFVDR